MFFSDTKNKADNQIPKKSIFLNKTTIFSFILFSIIFTRDLMEIGLNKNIIVAIVLFFFCISTCDEIIEMISLMIPLFWGLPGTYILLAALIILVIRNPRFPFTAVAITSIAFSFELIASTQSLSMDYPSLIKYISCFFLLFFCLYELDYTIDYRKCIELFIIGCLVLNYIIVFRTFKNISADWLNVFSSGHLRFGTIEKETGEVLLSLNPNSLASYSLAGICCSLALIKTSSKKKLYVFTIILLVISGLFSLSRTWMIVIVPILFLNFAQYSLKPRMLLILSFIFLLLFVASELLLERYPEFFQGIQSRFEEDNLSTAGLRTELFKEYFDEFFRSPRLMLLGAGVQDYRYVMGMVYSTHNSLEQIMICLGLPFGCSFIYLLTKPAISFIEKKIPLTYWLPIIGITFFSQSIQFLNPEILMLPYIIGIFSLQLGSQGKKLKNETPGADVIDLHIDHGVIAGNVDACEEMIEK